MGDWIDTLSMGKSASKPIVLDPPTRQKPSSSSSEKSLGVYAGICRKADSWADAEHLAIAPDMFGRFEPRYDVDPDVPAQMQDAFCVIKQFELAKAVSDVEAVIRSLRADGMAKIGIAGYCMGGSVAYLAAARTDVDASVGYYAHRSFFAQHLA